MGHIRLGTIPTTRSWESVVSSVVRPAIRGKAPHKGAIASDDIPRIAVRTLRASRGAMVKATSDEGLQHTYYLLTRLVLAARESDWAGQLRDLGIAIGPESTAMDLAAGFQGAVADHLSRQQAASDISDIAERAASEVLVRLTTPHAETLFGDSGEHLRLAVRRLSTKAEFGRLSQAFFGRFMARFLNFYLSRITTGRLGQQRLQQLGDISAFNEMLELHCEQSATIVRDFAAEWFSKTQYEEGITRANVASFAAVALKKLQAEMRRQEAETSAALKTKKQ